MVGGAVFSNPYETGQALIAWSISEWRFFEGWATASGIDLFKISCPRFMNLIFHYLTKDADAEGRKKFEEILGEIESEIIYNKGKVLERTDPDPETEDKKVIQSNYSWQAPPGWTPPGWQSDEENMASIQALMGPQIVGNKTIN